MKLLLYCTKEKPFLINDCGKFYLDNKTYNHHWKKGMIAPEHLNGKVAAECDFEVSEIKGYMCHWFSTYAYTTRRQNPFYFFSNNALLKASCLNYNEIYHYLGTGKDDGDVVGYAIHIKNLKIYDDPKELSLCNFSIEKAPQNMCYATKRIIKTIDVHYTYPNGKVAKPSVEINSFEKCVLISIRPEWLCKILNGEKTIEVRKKVLKEMFDNDGSRN